MTGAGKEAGAFRTIGEVADETGLAQHVLRYWETRFPQLRPLQRAGNRRYYRPEDVALVRRIDGLLNRDGYTIRGVQQLLASERRTDGVPAVASPSLLASLETVRNLIARALADDRG
ncbi:MAG: MerR family transcriptional regulator [Sphingomonas sp.]|jgi:DNA-binding transcriptional MerR regulator